MDQLTILIVSDDAEFSRVVMGRWQAEWNVPAFTLMSGDLCRNLDPDGFDVAIVGAVRPDVMTAVLQTLDSTGKPVLLVCEAGQTVQSIRDAQPRIMLLVQHEGWLDALVLVAAETLRRSQAMVRVQRAERANALLERQATLGRYMLEMRHTLNNALTSVLGNSELLLLEPEPVSPPERRSQIETIRNMAVRMHEILTRFSSIDQELSVLEKQVQKVNGTRAKVANAGS